MRRLRWRIFFALAPCLVGLAIVSLATTVWLAVWVPTKGKAWLEARLEERLPVEVTIGSMRATLLRGLVLTDVHAVDRKTHTEWFSANALQAHATLWPWLITRHIGFRLVGTVTSPCATSASISGRYQTTTRQLTANVVTADIPLPSVIPPLRAYAPSSLKDGRVRANLQVTWNPDAAPTITGELLGQHLRWEEGAVTAEGTVAVEGSFLSVPSPSSPWRTNLTIRLDRGQMAGLPIINEATGVSGSFHLTDQSVTIQALRGRAAGILWTLEGALALRQPYQAELAWRTSGDWITRLAQLWPAASAWQPTGQAEILVVCRGPLQQWPDVEVMGRAQVHETALTWSSFPHRLEHLNGVVTYDHLTKQLDLLSLKGSIERNPIAIAGTVRFATPIELAIAVDTDTALSLLTDLDPAHNPLSAATGRADVTLHLHGPATALTWEGEATFSDATLLFRGFPQPLEAINGTLRFTHDSVTVPQLPFVLHGQAITLSGAVTDLPQHPHVVAHARLAEGSLAVDATWQPDRTRVDRAEILLGQSQLLIHGDVGRSLAHTSQLTMTGSLELSDLRRLPWLKLEGLKSWNLSGMTTLRLRVVGPLNDWHSLEAQGLIRSDTLSVKDLPIRALSAELEQRQGHATVRVTNAFLADGRCIGQYVLQHESPADRFLLEFDLTRANLAQLAAAIPPWRERHLDGTLSAHISLLGNPGARPSYHGDGWVHANGERLAEIPLLDRLLKGFFGALAGRLGLESFRRAQITEIAAQWQLAQEVLTTEDLRLSGFAGTEPISIYVRGSVGFDKTLDLTVEPELSEQLVLQSPTTATPANTILKTVGGLERLRRLVGRHHLGGTIDKPDYKFEFSLDQILTQLLPTGLQNLLDSLH